MNWRNCSAFVSIGKQSSISFLENTVNFSEEYSSSALLYASSSRSGSSSSCSSCSSSSGFFAGPKHNRDEIHNRRYPHRKDSGRVSMTAYGLRPIELRSFLRFDQVSTTTASTATTVAAANAVLPLLPTNVVKRYLSESKPHPARQ